MTHVAHALHVCLLSVLHSINFAIVAMCLQKFAGARSCASMLCCQKMARAYVSRRLRNTVLFSMGWVPEFGDDHMLAMGGISFSANYKHASHCVHLN